MTDTVMTTVRTEIPLLVQSTIDSIAKRLGKSTDQVVLDALNDYIKREGIQPPNADFVSSQLAKGSDKLKKLGVEHISIFGSVARGEELPGSDVDLVLDFFPEEKPDIFLVEDIRVEISSMLDSLAKLDLVVRYGSSPLLLARIEKEERRIF